MNKIKSDNPQAIASEPTEAELFQKLGIGSNVVTGFLTGIEANRGKNEESV